MPARPGRLDARHVRRTVAAERTRAIVVAGNAIADPWSTSRPRPGARAHRTTSRRSGARPRLIADDGWVLAPGEPGTGVLANRGPLPPGHHGDADRTAATFRFDDGVRYAVPGDPAELTPDGDIRFFGRGAGVITTGDRKVHAPGPGSRPGLFRPPGGTSSPRPFSDRR
ncbi:hypothetical protein [Pseudonocardia alni]|uniref:Uncharacterized protein n=1 Tax=Pseudonocardia alni TaxID=33907 RepID=A0A852W2T9_PSEA5|nr:hypothetical protein [Pseudonocardia antarctica]NYG01134.1 hypothetical protein [Pseudonocardia antarctica]